MTELQYVSDDHIICVSNPYTPVETHEMNALMLNLQVNNGYFSMRMVILQVLVFFRGVKEQAKMEGRFMQSKLLSDDH